MNKELFVSSTPHETKVGLVEDDLLAEVYLERENEYTLAGSIYKGRVTRVLPGMQSAFVDIGLERDAFLYVSDFMELEAHDDDLTDVVPANRNVPDLRQQPSRLEAPVSMDAPQAADGTESDLQEESGQEFVETDVQGDVQPTAAAGAIPEQARDSQNRERGGYRGRRRRRGGRRDGRSDGRDRGPARWIPAGTSLQARRPDTSPCCCPENQFPSTSATPSSRRPWSRSVSQSLRSSPNPQIGRASCRDRSQ